jgi:hypothetical protein
MSQSPIHQYVGLDISLKETSIVSSMKPARSCGEDAEIQHPRRSPRHSRSTLEARYASDLRAVNYRHGSITDLRSVGCPARAQLLVYDRAVIQRARRDETARQLMSVPGVGAVVVLAYMTGVEDPTRFRKSSSVGAYFGMTPARYQSGEVDRAGRVSECGDGMVRGLLFEAAKVLLSRSARPCALQSWGRALAARIGTKKATMAVARKLAVLLHRMWTSGATFRWRAQRLRHDDLSVEAHSLLKQRKAVPAGTGLDDRAIHRVAACAECVRDIAASRP